MKLNLIVLLACLAFPVAAAADGVNEEWVLETGALHSVSFTMNNPLPVHVTVVPVKNCDKGLTVRIVPVEDLDACTGRAQGPCRSLGGFDGFKVRAMDHTEVIQTGRWTFFVQNTENKFFRATVHVSLVINPS